MKFAHLSDLHLGKRLHEFSLAEDQEHILKEIVRVVESENVDAVLIAGDLYDKAVPSAEAVTLCDRFLSDLARTGREILIISGNHDSAERLAFGRDLMKKGGVRVAGVYDGTVESAVFHDEHGDLTVWMLPFLHPAHVRRFFPEADTGSCSAALKTALDAAEIDFSRRNVLMTHQFVTGSTPSDSEDISVGGTDSVDADVFGGFDYVALGHLHHPQRVTADTIRYCGSPLKYSFSEANSEKSVTIVEFGEKGDVSVDAVPLRPLRDLREIRGSYDEVTAKSFYDGTATGDYLRITLTDEEDIPDAVRRLRVIYPRLTRLDYDNARTRAWGQPAAAPTEEPRALSPIDLFGAFYEAQNGTALSAEQRAFAEALIKSITEERP